MAMHRLEIGGGPSDLAGVEANQRQQDAEDHIQLAAQKQAQDAYAQQMHFNYQAQQMQQDQQYKQQALMQALGIHKDEFGRQQALDAQAAKQQGIMADQGQQKITQAGDIAQSQEANRLAMEHEKTVERAQQASDQTAQRDNAAKLQAQSRSDMLTDKNDRAVNEQRARELAAVQTQKGLPADFDLTPMIQQINAKYDAQLSTAHRAQPQDSSTQSVSPQQSGQNNAPTGQQTLGNGQPAGTPATPADTSTPAETAAADAQETKLTGKPVPDTSRIGLSPAGALTYSRKGWDSPPINAGDPEVIDAKTKANQATYNYQQVAAGLGEKINAGGALTPSQAKAIQDARQAHDEGIAAYSEATGQPVMTPVESAQAQLEIAKANFKIQPGVAQLKQVQAANQALQAANTDKTKTDTALRKADEPSWTNVRADTEKQIVTLTKAAEQATGDDKAQVQAALKQAQDRLGTINESQAQVVPFQQFSAKQKQLSSQNADLATAVTEQIDNMKAMNVDVDKFAIGSKGTPRGTMKQQLYALNQYGHPGQPDAKGKLPDQKLADKAESLPAPSYLNDTLGFPVKYDPATGTMKATGDQGGSGYGADPNAATRKEKAEMIDALLSGDPYKYPNNSMIKQFMQNAALSFHSMAGTSQSNTNSATESSKAGVSVEPGFMFVPNLESGQSETNAQSVGQRQIQVFKNPEDTFRQWGARLQAKIPNVNDVQGLLQQSAKAATQQPGYEDDLKTHQQNIQTQMQQKQDAFDKETNGIQKELQNLRDNQPGWMTRDLGKDLDTGGAPENNQRIAALKAQLKSRGAPESETTTAISQAASAGKGARVVSGADPYGNKVK